MDDLNAQFSTGTPVVVAAGTTAYANFALRPGGTITGRVTSAATSEGLPYVEVQIWSTQGVYLPGVRTDASGTYSVSGLVTGSYRARTFNGQGHIDEVFDNMACPGCDLPAGTPIAVTEDLTTAGIDFVLDRGGEVKGRVTDAASGAGLENVLVSLTGPPGGASALSDVDGHFIVSGLASGSYRATTSNPLGYVDELYDNVVCEPWCATDGKPIAVLAGTTVEGIVEAFDGGGGWVASPMRQRVSRWRA